MKVRKLVLIVEFIVLCALGVYVNVNAETTPIPEPSATVQVDLEKPTPTPTVIPTPTPTPKNKAKVTLKGVKGITNMNYIQFTIKSNVEKVQYEIVNVSTKAKFKGKAKAGQKILKKKMTDLNSAYYVRAKGYDTVVKSWGKWSKKYYILPSPKIDENYALNNINLFKVGLKWNKITGAKKYIIYISTDGKHFRKLVTTRSTTYLVTRESSTKRLDLHGFRYFRVKAVRGSYKTSSNGCYTFRVGYNNQ